MNKLITYFLEQHFRDHDTFDLNQLHRVFRYLKKECKIDILGKDSEVFVNAISNVDKDIIEIYRRINPLEEDNQYTIFLKKCTTIKDLLMVSRTPEVTRQIQNTREMACNFHDLTMEFFETIIANKLPYDILKIYQCYNIFEAEKMHHLWKGGSGNN